MDVVIVNWNSGRMLTECLQSVGHNAGVVADVVVVDNASADDSLTLAAAAAPAASLEVTTITNPENRGFATACNQGAAAAEAPYILFLNPDVRLPEGALATAAAELHSRGNIGVVGIQLRSEDGPVQRACARLPRGRDMITHALGLDRLFPGRGYVMREWPHDHSRSVDHVIGAFYLIRRPLFESLGGFDERFFLYLEDLDLSARVRAAGSSIRYLSDVSAVHVGGGTSRAIPARRLYLSLRARLQYAHKHFSLPAAVCVDLATLAAEPVIRTVMALLRASPATAGQTLRAYAALLGWLLRGAQPDRAP